MTYNSPSYAGLEKLMKYAETKGTLSNVNAPAIIKDQNSGFMTGGSAIFRGPRPMELQPLVVQTPSLKFDACTFSGDVRFGSMSFIKGKEFTEFFKRTARSGAAYLTILLMKSRCPQCSSVMEYLDTIQREINGLMMDQCTAGEQLANGVFNKLVSSNKTKCMMNSNKKSSNSDLYQTTKECNDDPDKYGNDDDFDSLLGDQFNLVWKALSKGNANTDSNFKELIMSISGTIIGKKTAEGRFEFERKPSLIQNHDMLEKYMGVESPGAGSKVKMYSCNTADKCLAPTIAEIEFSSKETLYGNIYRVVKSLVEKAVKDDPSEYNDDQQAVIGFSYPPILEIIDLELAQKGSPENLMVTMSEYIDLVTYDVMTHFFDMLLSRASDAVQNLEYSQLDDAIISGFKEDIERIRRYLRDARYSAFQRANQQLQLRQRLEHQAKEFEARFMQISNVAR
jgi:conjugative transfer pilus assembly protein TraH